MNKIIRYGYGDNFNDLFIEGNIIIKITKNDYGLIKIKHEIAFYNYILNNNILFSIPKIYELNENMYKMEYLSNCKPLYKILINTDTKTITMFLDKIYLELNKLHKIKRIGTSEKYKENLFIEAITKIKKRYLEIINIISVLPKINKVNGLNILSIENVFHNIEQYLNTIDYNDKELNLIHGDPNFNNILVDSYNNIYFIDPRGYFGNDELFGIKEYDYAKIKFALSGYDLFDSESISDIIVVNNEIIFKIDTIIPLMDILDNTLSSFLMIIIWLGNAHCFKNNINKCLKSYYYSLYLATLFFKDILNL